MKQEALTMPETDAIALRGRQESEAAAVLAMIERVARDPTVDISRIEALLGMRDRIVAQDARRSFDAALAAMQPEIPVTVRRGVIDIGRGKPMGYAKWEDINDDLGPVLSRHGFALSFRCGNDAGKVRVTAILSHSGGHREETTMELPIDTSGSKNAVQAIGSSTSYGKRYAAGALLNLTSRGEDDNGRGGKVEPITDEQCAQIVDMLDALTPPGNRVKFCKYLGVPSLSELPASRFQEAVEALAAKRRA